MPINMPQVPSWTLGQNTHLESFNTSLPCLCFLWGHQLFSRLFHVSLFCLRYKYIVLHFLFSPNWGHGYQWYLAFLLQHSYSVPWEPRTCKIIALILITFLNFSWANMVLLSPALTPMPVLLPTFLSPATQLMLSLWIHSFPQFWTVIFYKYFFRELHCWEGPSCESDHVNPTCLMWDGDKHLLEGLHTGTYCTVGPLIRNLVF